MMERVLPRGAWHRALKGLERLLPANEGNMSLRFKVRHFAQGFQHPVDERIQGWMASFPLAAALTVLEDDLVADVDPEEVLEPSRHAFCGARGQGELAAQTATWVATYLECSILTKVDRAGMMHSLEVRAPYLDPKLTATLASLPPGLVFRGGRGKALMRRVAARMLPPEVLAKPKKGLGVPQATWLRTVLRERVEAALEKSRNGGWFDHAAIARMWSEHLAGRADYRRGLWNFVFSFPFQDN